MACGDSKGNADQEAELEDAGPLAPDADGGMKSPPPDPKDDAGEEPPEPEPELEGTLAIVDYASVLAGTDELEYTVGLDVVVNHADGSLAFHGKTTADGPLELRVPENGSVSLLTTDSRRDETTAKIVTTRTVRTWFSPPDGHVIRSHGVRSQASVPAAPNTPMRLVFPAIGAANTPAGTTSVTLSLACSGGAGLALTSTFEMAEYRGCAGSDTYDAVAFAKNAAGDYLGYAMLLNQPFKPGETVTHSLKPTQTDFAEVTATLTPLPEGTKSLQFELYATSATRPGLRIEHRYSWRDPTTAQTAVLRVPVGFAGTYEVSESVRFWEEGAMDETFKRKRIGSSLPASATISPLSLARVTSLAPTELKVLSRPSFALSLASTGSREGCVETFLRWRDSAAIETDWYGNQPADAASSARFPELPEALAEYAPQTAGSMGTPSVYHRHSVGKTGLDACGAFQEGETLYWSRDRY